MEQLQTALVNVVVIISVESVGEKDVGGCD